MELNRATVRLSLSSLNHRARISIELHLRRKAAFIAELGHTVFAYVIEGKGYFELERDPYHYEKEGENYFDFKRECIIEPENLILFEDGEELFISTENDGVRFLLISGKPINESIAWYGPIVMNTQDELELAFRRGQQDPSLYQNSPHQLFHR